MNLTARIAATFNRSGAARDNVVGAAMPAVSRGSKGSGAPSVRRLRATLSVLALTIAAFALTAAPASAAPPTVTTPVVSDASYTTAHVEGKVTTDGSGLAGHTNYQFQYSVDQTNWSAGFVSGFGTNIEGPATDRKVEGTITVPKGGTKYFVRLVANNGLTPGADTEVFSPAPNPSFTTLTVDPPTVVSTDDASEIFSLSAKASGEIERPANPDLAFDITDCRFEYVTEAQFGATGFDGADSAECVEPLNNAPEGKTHVTAALSGLEPSTTYHLRLVAKNAAIAPGTKEAANFTTLPPVAKPTVIAADDATEITAHAAKASGEVQRPAGDDPALDTSCRFEYVTDADFDLTGFDNAGRADCVEALITSPDPGHPAVTVPVTAELSGLDADTTYHLRLTAENGGGTDTKDAASTFTTPEAVPITATVDSITEIGYTTAHVSYSFDRGDSPGGIWGLQYAPVGTEDWFGEINWGDEGNLSADVACIRFVNPAEWEHCTNPRYLKPGTTYKMRMVVRPYVGDEFTSAQPYPEFTTKGTSTPPSATLDPIIDFTATSAHFSGSIDTHAPAGPLPDEGKVPYKTKWHIECTPACKDVNGNEIGGTVEGDAGPQPIAGDFKRLDPNTDYEVRLIAVNVLGTGESTQDFKTKLIKPTVKAFPGGSDGKGGYVLQGSVNPNGSPISDCTFAWGPEGHEELDEYVFQADCSPMPNPRNEVQSIKLEAIGAGQHSVPLTGGQFRLTYRGQTTNDLPYNATPAEVEAALEAFSTIAPGDVDVTGAPQSYEVTFQGALAGTNPPQIEGKQGTIPLATDPIPASAFIAVSTLTQGGSSTVTVEAPLTGLTPDANYNFRLFATNAAGTEKTENLVFKPTLAKAAPCANEQLRTENSSLALPECRAYEMVTPPGKEGFGATLETYDGGARVAYRSEAGNIARSGRGGNVNLYVANRTDTGWETIPNLNGSSGSLYDTPSNVDSPNAGFTDLLTYSRDLRSSIWFLHRQGEPGSTEAPIAHLRNPDGTFAFIGNIGIGDGERAPGGVASSADLSHLLTVATNSKWGPGVYEFLGTGMDQPRRVDLDNSGAPVSSCIGYAAPGYSADSNALGLSISSDGGTVLYKAYGALDAVAGTCGVGDPPADEIWARVNGTTTVDVSASHCTRLDCNAPVNPTFAAATPDGSRVFFTTTQQLVNGDTDQTKDIYACDIPAGNPAPSADKANHCAAFRQVSGAQTGADVESVNATSENGATVFFTAKGVLADNKDALGEKAVAGDHNLYVWRTDASHPDGQTTFIARLDSNDLSPGLGQVAQTTPDGRYLIFTSASQFLDTDTDTARDVYRYDADTGELIRVSTNLFGVAGNGDFDVRTGAPAKHHPTTTVSDDGQKIVFVSTEALSPADGNAEPDVYLWTPARVSLISTGSSGFAPRDRVYGGVLNPAVAIDPSGENVYFESAQALTPADGDGSTDVYDARIGGGFSFAQAAPCTGETCQPEPTPAPPREAPLSAQPGPGNPPQPKPCPKGKVRNKKGKCVKKHKKHSGKKHHGKQHKRAGSNGGGAK